MIDRLGKVVLVLGLTNDRLELQRDAALNEIAPLPAVIVNVRHASDPGHVSPLSPPRAVRRGAETLDLAAHLGFFKPVVAGLVPATHLFLAEGSAASRPHQGPESGLRLAAR